MPGNEKTLKPTVRDITDSGRDDPTGEGKGKNFLVDEDYWIEVGWVQTSEDPIKGTDQNREAFGDSVKKNISDQTSLFNNRTANDLKNRWSEKLRGVLAKYNAEYILQNDIVKSGWAKKMYIEAATGAYETKSGDN